MSETHVPISEPFGWNVEQILVYIWQCMSAGQDEPNYPFERFNQSEMGKRLRLELNALAAERERVLLEEARWWHNSPHDCKLFPERESCQRIVKLEQAVATREGVKA